MATVTFAGTTIWNDASTGVGRVRWNRNMPHAVQSFEPLPRTGEKIRKILHTDAGGGFVPLSFRMTDAQIDSLITTLGGLIESEGTLVLPPGQSINNAVLVNAIMQRGDPADKSGTIYYQVLVILIFEVLA